MKDEAKKLTDEELGRIAESTFRKPGLWLGDVACAVRDAVAKGWEAERDELRAKLAAAEKTTTHPVTVRFDCTPEEVSRVLCESPGSREWDWDSLEGAAKARVIIEADAVTSHLATRAVVEVPEGVPTKEEIGAAFREHINNCDRHDENARQDGTTFAYNMLAPHLQQSSLPDKSKGEALGDEPRKWAQWFVEDNPAQLVAEEHNRAIDALLSASVDPKICETNWCKVWPNAKLLIRAGSESSGSINGDYYIDVYSDSGGVETFVLAPNEVYELGMHALSHAASQGKDVQLPIVTDSPEKRCDCIFCDYKGNSLKALKEHSAKCEKHPLWQSPIPAKTLNQLTEIGRKAYIKKHYECCGGDSGDSGMSQQNVVNLSRLAATEAILRAAKARVDIDQEDVIAWVEANYFGDFCELLNARIRFSVEVPDAAPEPIADPTTLNQLVEIGRKSWIGATRTNITNEKADEAFVIAILCAARPRLDVETFQQYKNGSATYIFDSQKYIDWLNSRITYAVGVPPEKEGNCMFMCFKEYGKYYTEARGNYDPNDDIKPRPERIQTILNGNSGRWPGLSSDGSSMHRLVLPDDGVPFIWPAECPTCAKLEAQRDVARDNCAKLECRVDAARKALEGGEA